jgi:hypothetical protein
MRNDPIASMQSMERLDLSGNSKAQLKSRFSLRGKLEGADCGRVDIITCGRDEAFLSSILVGILCGGETSSSLR